MSIKARLGDYIQEYSVRNRTEEDIPVYSVTNTQGFCQDYFGKEVASKDKSTYKIVPKGCFAYNPSRINVGSVDWQRYEDRVIVSPLYNVFSVAPQLDQQYLYYYLKSDFALQRIRAVATGSVRDNLKLAMLYEFPINLHSMEVQEEIVEKLDGVKRVISLREQELQTLDDLIKARFVEMFGDPINNDRQWKQITLLESLEEGRTVSYGIVQTGDDFEDGVPVFRPVDIAGGHIPKRTDLKKTDPMISAQYKRTLLKGNELLITVRGSVGETFQTNEEYEGCNVGRNIVPLLTNQNIINQRFLQELIATDAIKRWLKGITKGIALQGLNMSEFKEMPVIMPPIEEQQSFVRFAEQVDKSKVAVQKALDEAQLLFDSLMQQYFG